MARGRGQTATAPGAPWETGGSGPAPPPRAAYPPGVAESLALRRAPAPPSVGAGEGGGRTRATRTAALSPPNPGAERRAARGRGRAQRRRGLGSPPGPEERSPRFGSRAGCPAPRAE